MFVIKGIAFRFNAALGFGGGRRPRACTLHLGGLIGGGACKHAPCAESIGFAVALVQAKDQVAKAWYLGQAEWLEVPAGGRALWFPVGWWWGVLEIMHHGACCLLWF